jgi:hypothetical protein
MNEITYLLLSRGSVSIRLNKRKLELILEPARAVWAKDSEKNIFVVTADTRSACLSEILEEALDVSVRNYYLDK